MKRVTGTAHARAGLLGNPSDVYEGKTIALCLADFSASVTLEAAECCQILAEPDDPRTFDSFADMADSLAAGGCQGGLRLLRAAAHRFASAWSGWKDLPRNDASMKFTLAYQTSVPLQVGLAGSSAIVIAAMRALDRWFGVTRAPADMAEQALAAEVRDLDIPAGPQDRVIQAFGGLMHMDFKAPRRASAYTRLDPALLPPLFIAWDPRGGKASGRVHADVRDRWLAGDPQVREAIARFPAFADAGLDCLHRGDVAELKRLVDLNFDTRAAIWCLSERDIELVEIGRAQGAAVKFCGSGGSVIGVMDDANMFERIATAYRQAGYQALEPGVATVRE